MTSLEQTATTDGAAAAPVLAVRNLTVNYGPDKPAVKDASFDVYHGQVVAVVGESGSGKSTTALAAMGLLPGNAVVASGSIRFKGEEVVGMSPAALRSRRGRSFALIPQDPTVSLDPTQRIGHQIAEALRVHGLATRKQAAEKAVGILDAAGVDDPERRARQYPHEFSGGMRQRVLIGMAWSCNPELIIADEPTSALDVTVQRQILDRLDVLRRQHGTSVVLVTHDLAVAAERSDHLVVMSKGRIVEQGPTARVLAAPSHDYTRALLAAAPSRHGAGPARVRRPVIPAAAESRIPLVNAKGLVKEFTSRGPDGGRFRFRAVDDVSFGIRRGSTFSIVGESGSGKSTTARLVMALEKPTAGSVEFDGVDVTGLQRGKLRELRQRFQLIQQNPYSSLNPRWSLQRIIEEPLKSFGIGTAANRAARSRELLDQVGLPSSYASRWPQELSGGQRQRVAIARALALKPELVVCDEPISALDVSVQAQILELLATLQQELQLSYLFISHDLSVVEAISDDVAVMQAGRIVQSGPAEQVFNQPLHDYTQRLIEAIPGRRVTA
ncbi:MULTISPECIES: dipeptide ABC transporter ATP-binding protein [unclassified Pseudarthrobacter]|uniref:dipeptide ABC transporter ATP-binding protein n=1 Tax=unclassified Pseudarthrobacter TaxID=2647000 RepID=UPI003639C579